MMVIMQEISVEKYKYVDIMAIPEHSIVLCLAVTVNKPYREVTPASTLAIGLEALMIHRP